MTSQTSEQLELFFSEKDARISNKAVERLSMPDAEVYCYQKFFSREESDVFFQELRDKTRWQQERITYYGKEVDLPRLTAWHGEPGKPYTYSHIAMAPEPWTPVLLDIKARVESAAGVKFNSVLLNLYRRGKDGVSWHRDNEPELGENPVIGSVSLGETRRFQFRHRSRKDMETISLDLTHGSLLIMKGGTQKYWEHQITKTVKPVGERINLTFRFIY